MADNELDPDQHTLSWRMDGQRPDDMRREAVAALARDGQMRINAYCRKRGIADEDILNDLSNDIWLAVVQFVLDGRYIDKGRPAMAFVYGVAHRILQHYFDRDPHVKGQIIPLEAVLDDNSVAVHDPFESLEDAIDQGILFERLIERLDSQIDRDIAHFFWDHHDQTPPKIADHMDLNVKTVRSSLKRIAKEVSALREQ